jgi:predicted ABC-type ATPase
VGASSETLRRHALAVAGDGHRPDAAAVAAGRVMLDRLRFLARERRDFAFETTLSGRGHARWLRSLRASGYNVHLIFLALPTADLAALRVRMRVRGGGHDVPEAVVRRRFGAGLRNFIQVYSDIADSWQVYDNSSVRGPRLIAARMLGGETSVEDQTAWDRIHEAR